MIDREATREVRWQTWLQGLCPNRIPLRWLLVFLVVVVLAVTPKYSASEIKQRSLSSSPIMASSPSLFFNSIPPRKNLKPHIFDVTHAINPWWTLARFEVPDEVLSRHNLNHDMLHKLTLLDGHCVKWFLAEPSIVTATGYSYSKELRSEKLGVPPLRVAPPKAIWVWNRTSEPPEKVEDIEEDIAHVGGIEWTRHLKVSPARDVDSRIYCLIGYRVYTATETAPTGWKTLNMSPSGTSDDLWSALVYANEWPDEDSDATKPVDPLGSSIAKRLGKLPIPFCTWKDADPEMGRVTPATDEIHKWELELRCPIPWCKSPTLFQYSAIVHDVTGPMIVATEGSLEEYGMPVFAQPDGRFCMIPSMFPYRVFDRFNCSAALDTNQDQVPDLLLIDWTQSESYGSVILLVDDAGLYLVLSSGGMYCP